MAIRWLVNPTIHCGCRGEDDNHTRLGATTKSSRLFVNNLTVSFVPPSAGVYYVFSQSTSRTSIQSVNAFFA